MIEREKATKIEECYCDTSLVCDCECLHCAAPVETANSEAPVMREKGVV